MGGKSSSSTTTTTKQEVFTENNAADASGVIAGNVLQGEITYTEEFGDTVAGAFGKLVELANTAILGAGELAELSITGAGEIAGTSLDKVSQRAETIDNPDLASTRAFTPLFIAGGALATVVALFYIWRK